MASEKVSGYVAKFYVAPTTTLITTDKLGAKHMSQTGKVTVDTTVTDIVTNGKVLALSSPLKDLLSQFEYEDVALTGVDTEASYRVQAKAKRLEIEAVLDFSSTSALQTMLSDTTSETPRSYVVAVTKGTKTMYITLNAVCSTQNVELDPKKAGRVKATLIYEVDDSYGAEYGVSWTA